MKCAAVHLECGEIGFYLPRVPLPGETALSKDVTMLDGTKPKPFSVIRCGACGRAFRASPQFIEVESE